MAHEIADGPKKTGELDRSLVAMGQAHEGTYWTKHFGVPEAKLKEAVAAVGNSVVKVQAWLKAN